MSFEQIEKFQCLTSSTTQGLSTGILRIHVTRVTCPQTCPKVGQLFLVKKPQKTTMIDFNDHSPLKYIYVGYVFHWSHFGVHSLELETLLITYD